MEGRKHRHQLQRRNLRELDDFGRNALLRKLICRLQHIVGDNAVGQDRQIAALVQNRDRFQVTVLISAFSAARITHGDRPVQLQHSLSQHRAQLGKARRAENAHIWHRAQITDVKAAVVRIAVVADDAGAIDAEHQMQPLQRRVMDEHIIRTLQEAGIDRRNGLEPLLGHAAGHRDCMPFCNTDIIEPVRVPLGKGRQARAGQHGRRDGDDRRIFIRQLRERFAKHVGKVRLRRRQCTGHRVKRADTVIFFRCLLRVCDALALLRHDVQQHRLAQVARPAQHFLQLRLIVPVHRADVVKAHVVEHVVWQDEVFYALFHAVQNFIQSACLADGAAIKLLEVQIAWLHALFGQQRRHAADVFVDGHAVVVEHDDHRLAALPGIRQALVCQTAGQGTVADEGNDVIIRPRERARPGHAQRDGDRRGGVAGHKCIVHALVRLREAGDAAELPQRRKRFAPPGQDLVHIALMTDVEHEPVFFGVIHPVNRDRELHRAEIGRQMPAGFRKILDQKRTKFRTQCRNFFLRQRLQVGR